MYPILQMSEFSTRRPCHRVEQLIPNAIRFSTRRMPKYLCSDVATLVVLRLSFSHWWRRPAQAPAWLPRASLRHLFRARARRDDVSDGLASKSIGNRFNYRKRRVQSDMVTVADTGLVSSTTSSSLRMTVALARKHGIRC